METKVEKNRFKEMKDKAFLLFLNYSNKAAAMEVLDVEKKIKKLQDSNCCLKSNLLNILNK